MLSVCVPWIDWPLPSPAPNVTPGFAAAIACETLLFVSLSKTNLILCQKSHSTLARFLVRTGRVQRPKLVRSDRQRGWQGSIAYPAAYRASRGFGSSILPGTFSPVILTAPQPEWKCWLDSFLRILSVSPACYAPTFSRCFELGTPLLKGSLRASEPNTDWTMCNMIRDCVGLSRSPHYDMRWLLNVDRKMANNWFSIPCGSSPGVPSIGAVGSRV